jgi:hypothetical protein
MRKILTLLLSLFILSLTSSALAAPPSKVFQREALKVGIDPVVLEGICRYESGNGFFKHHHNKNGTWDVGFCQNHRYYKGDKKPKIPTNADSIKEAAKELQYWHRHHERFCVHTLKATGKCGYTSGGKFRGMKNFKRPHPWWEHYNHGFRVLTNRYGKKVQCFINGGFKRCKKNQWRKVNF